MHADTRSTMQLASRMPSRAGPSPLSKASEPGPIKVVDLKPRCWGQGRRRTYVKAMTAGMSRARACLFRVELAAASCGLWLSVLVLALMEKLAKWSV